MKTIILSPTHVREDERGSFIEFLNGQRVANVSCGKMRKGAVMGNHYHKKTSVYFFLVSGSAAIINLNVQTKKRESFSLHKNEGTVFNPFVSHAIEFRQDSTFIMAKTRAYNAKNTDTYVLGQSAEWEEACLGYRRNMWWRTRRMKKFDIHPSYKVLDLGCGDGLNMVVLRELGVRDIVGVDISQKILQEAKKNNPKNTFYRAPAEKLPFQKETFDVVFLDSVFHHLLEYKPALLEIHRILRKGGYLCFSEPHASWIRKILDELSLSPMSRFIPILHKRHEHFEEGELPLMRRWLKTEPHFDTTIQSLNMKKIFYRVDFLSRIGKFQK